MTGNVSTYQALSDYFKTKPYLDLCYTDEEMHQRLNEDFWNSITHSNVFDKEILELLLQLSADVDSGKEKFVVMDLDTLFSDDVFNL